MKRLVITLIVLIAGAWCVTRSGSFLVRESPQRSDVIVVLAGEYGDHRFWRGMELLRQGYGREMFVDASESVLHWGRSEAALAEQFVAETSGDQAGKVKVCQIAENSTVAETRYVSRCLQSVEPRPKSVLLVTSDYHTRRAVDIFRKKLPGYEWSVASSTDDRSFGEQWWKRREWAKTNLGEWERLMWWELVDRWRG